MKTTIEISAPLLRRAKKVAADEGRSLRALFEEGLAQALDSHRERGKSIPPLLVVRGRGLNPEFAEGGWAAIRDTLYRGRGA